MEFIDHTGHIFSLPSYQELPIGYEYEVNPYIFWCEDEYANKLSINNYYIKPIKIVFDETDNFEFSNIDITCDSQVFQLLPSSKIQDLLEKNVSIHDYVSLSESDFVSELHYTTAYDKLGKSVTYSSDFSLIRNIRETFYWYITKEYNVIPYTNTYDVYKYKDETGVNKESLDKKIFTIGKKYVITETNKEYGVVLYKDDKKPSNFNNYAIAYEEDGKYIYACINKGVLLPLLKSDLSVGNIYDNVLLYNANIVTVEQRTDIEYYYVYYNTHNLTYNVLKVKELTNINTDINKLYKYTQRKFKTELEADNFINSHEESISLYDSLKSIIDRYELALSNFNVNDNNYNMLLDNINLYNILLSSIKDKNTKIVDFVKNEEKHNLCLIPFYVVANAAVTGTWTTNILININNNGKVDSETGKIYSDDDVIYNYTHITVGGVFYNESEELIINGINMGIELPKDILKALYQTPFYSSIPNETLYNDKVKEYLINYMLLRGEQGNFNSAIAGLKWFGWGENLSISKLLQTDNNVITQYIHDYFSISNDILHSFYAFKTSTMISLGLQENNETGEYYNINFNNEFFGEGKPILENLFEKTVEVKYDEQDITFYKSYYNFVFDELALKLAALTYYYQKYFLPVHLKINSASVRHTVYANDIKLKTAAYTTLNEAPVLMQDQTVSVKFTDNVYFFNYNEVYVDSNFNEFENTKYEGMVDHIDAYYIYDTSVIIPISINTQLPYCKCTLILAFVNSQKRVFESHFDYIPSTKYAYKNFVIYPKAIQDNFDIHYWLDNEFVIYLCVNDKWFNHHFTLKIPDLNIQMGKLTYKYWADEDKTITGFNQLTDTYKFKSFMYNDGFVKLYDINIKNELKNIKNNDMLSEMLTKYITEQNIITNNKYLNRVYMFDIYDNETNQILLYNALEPINKLYEAFFDEKGNAKIMEINKIPFDCYVMHDLNQWYCVFISQYTINGYKEKDLDINETVICIDDKYTIKFVKADNKFLINRMYIDWTYGKNIFNTDDIIVSSIGNFERIPFNYNIGSKWHILPKSINTSNEKRFDSSSNTTILSMNNDAIAHETGYYTLKVRYCLDDNIQHQYYKSCNYKII